jgi:hypothetical protein
VSITTGSAPGTPSSGTRTLPSAASVRSKRKRLADIRPPAGRRGRARRPHPDSDPPPGRLEFQELAGARPRPQRKLQPVWHQCGEQQYGRSEREIDGQDPRSKAVCVELDLHAVNSKTGGLGHRSGLPGQCATFGPPNASALSGGASPTAAVPGYAIGSSWLWRAPKETPTMPPLSAFASFKATDASRSVSPNPMLHPRPVALRYVL